MSRPKPRVLKIATAGNKCTEIHAASGCWCVLYRGCHFNLKTYLKPGLPTQEKYLRTSFPAKGYGIALARRLNALFGTTDFTVVEYPAGTEVKL